MFLGGSHHPMYGFGVSSNDVIRYGDLKSCIGQRLIPDTKMMDLCILGGEEHWALPGTIDQLSGWECLRILRMSNDEKRKHCREYSPALVCQRDNEEMESELVGSCTFDR